MNYFEQCKTIEEVKVTYKKLIFKYHPDITQIDTTEIMAQINNQYEEASKRLKNTHKNAQRETYQKETEDTSKEFKEIINKIVHLKNVLIEICGDWIWITGNTKEYKEILRSLKFIWSKNKQAWYFHHKPYNKWSKQVKTLEEIREMFGSKKIRQEEVEKVKVLKKSY